MTHMHTSMRTQDVRVQYLSGDEIFAEIRERLELAEGGDVEAAVAAIAEGAAYFNQLVPDLSYRVDILPADPDDPCPPAAGAGVKPICRRCGAEELVKDACARWDQVRQLWSLAGTYDCTTCENCGAEGDDLARWVEASLVAAPPQVASDLAVMLGQPGLVEEPQFRQFCLEHARTNDLAAAAAVWAPMSGKS